jgi:hypothetical protein
MDATPTHKIAFESMRDLMLNQVFPKYIMKYKTPRYYPVIVGGININRCLSREPKGAKLIDSIFSSDIDIDFVIVRPIEHLDVGGYEDPPAYVEVHEARMSFLREISSDPLVKLMISEYKKTEGLDITLHIDDSMLQKKEWRVYKVRLVSMRFKISKDEDDRGPKEVLYSEVLVDSPIYASDNSTNFKLYRRFLPKLKNPIPYYIHNKVPFATCNFIYYDTVRMMIYYSNALKVSATVKDKHFNFIKYVRYVMKFTMLYLLINDVALKKEASIKSIYEEAKNILSRIRIDDKFSDIPSEEVVVLKRLIHKLSMTKMTNLIDIQSIIESQNTPTVVKGLPNSRI